MKKWLCLMLLSISVLASDTVNYGEWASKFMKSRMVADYITGAVFDVTSTNKTIQLPRATLSVTINNIGDYTIYVSNEGTTAIYKDNGNASTTAGDSLFDFGEDISTWGLKRGTLIILDEGDGNDGVYTLWKFVSGNVWRLDRDLSVSHSGTQDYLITSYPIGSGEVHSIDLGTGILNFISENTSQIRLNITYQRES